jgi:hypothetical protein
MVAGRLRNRDFCHKEGIRRTPGSGEGGIRTHGALSDTPVFKSRREWIHMSTLWGFVHRDMFWVTPVGTSLLQGRKTSPLGAKQWSLTPTNN